MRAVTAFVATGGLAQDTAGGVSSARVQEAILAGSTGNGFSGARTAQPNWVTHSFGSGVGRGEG